MINPPRVTLGVLHFQRQNHTSTQRTQTKEVRPRRLDSLSLWRGPATEECVELFRVLVQQVVVHVVQLICRHLRVVVHVVLMLLRSPLAAVAAYGRGACGPSNPSSLPLQCLVLFGPLDDGSIPEEPQTATEAPRGASVYVSDVCSCVFVVLDSVGACMYLMCVPVRHVDTTPSRGGADFTFVLRGGAD